MSVNTGMIYQHHKARNVAPAPHGMWLCGDSQCFPTVPRASVDVIPSQPGVCRRMGERNRPTRSTNPCCGSREIFSRWDDAGPFSLLAITTPRPVMGCTVVTGVVVLEIFPPQPHSCCPVCFPQISY